MKDLPTDCADHRAARIAPFTPEVWIGRSGQRPAERTLLDGAESREAHRSRRRWPLRREGDGPHGGRHHLERLTFMRAPENSAPHGLRRADSCEPEVLVGGERERSYTRTAKRRSYQLNSAASEDE